MLFLEGRGRKKEGKSREQHRQTSWEARKLVKGKSVGPRPGCSMEAGRFPTQGENWKKGERTCGWPCKKRDFVNLNGSAIAEARTRKFVQGKRRRGGRSRKLGARR